ncbi:hypothetical protein U2100_15330, partial [Listeria monocytogenes]
AVLLILVSNWLLITILFCSAPSLSYQDTGATSNNFSADSIGSDNEAYLHSACLRINLGLTLDLPSEGLMAAVPVTVILSYHVLIL